ncbi:MAG: hypothetical protein Q8P31_02285 [Bacillota bacterium]|nr:hypothetical protein [Bacillota bacterium]
MRVDFTAAQQFLDYLDGRLPAETLLDHPAYRAVRAHAELCYGVRLGGAHLEAAVRGDDSPFFGLRRVAQNLPRVRALLDVIGRRSDAWIAEAGASLGVIAPGVEQSGVTVYPICGYDAGIGLREAVCLNVNWGVYLDRPEEFLYMMIHEATHVLYGRRNPMSALASVVAPAEWLSLFWRMTQDEGFAVYAPLALRRERGHMGDESHPILRDYQVLSSAGRLAWYLASYREAARRLAGRGGGDGTADRDGRMALVFGPHRLTYRVGCELIRRIGEHGGGGGAAAVAEAFRMTGDEFMRAHGGLVGVDGFYLLTS